MNENLNYLLQDAIKRMQDDDYDNESKLFYYEQAIKILAEIKKLELGA